MQSGNFLRMGELQIALGSDRPSARVGIGLVGGGKGGSALLDLVLDWPAGKVAVVVDPRPEAPALGKAKALGIPTAAHHLEVFAYPVNLVLETTGQPAILNDLLRAKPAGVEVMGAGSLRFVWDLLTERKGLEEQFLQSQKMEAVGRLAGGVAHDFNNVLMVIMGSSELLMEGLSADDPLRRYTEEIKKATDRGAALTRQLLTFSRRQVLQPKVLDLNTVLASIDRMLRLLIGEDVELVTMLDLALGPVNVDPVQIEQVIMNLAVNARDAMPQGGPLTLETANVELDAAFVRQHPGAQPGPHVLLAVSDAGVGMSAEIQAHLFEPFFTTKGRGKGTGLGLSTVYGIVKQHHGSIVVESELGRGTAFKIYLPRVQEAVEAVEARTALGGSSRGSETVLVVEDEVAVRKLIGGVLSRSGYTVLEARHGGEALQICVRYEGPIHLLLTDVVMPQMNGWELAQRLAPARPDMKILYMSGYLADTIGYGGVPEAKKAFLQKPFTPDVLLNKVREAMDAPRARPRLSVA